MRLVRYVVVMLVIALAGSGAAAVLASGVTSSRHTERPLAVAPGGTSGDTNTSGTGAGGGGFASPGGAGGGGEAGAGGSPGPLAGDD